MLFNLTKKHRESSNLARLRALSLFSNLKAGELAIINNLLHERNYVKNEIVFDEGEEGQAIYFIFSGSVIICRQGRPIDGMIAELSSGQFFGELALLDNSPRAAQVRAVEDCTLAALFREDFMGLLETHAAIASKISLQLSRHIGQRLRDAIHRYVV
jgi:CRP/FNR family cyclic AMP-dependent transcriptional regulator